MYRIIALVGESGCGKDYAASALCDSYDKFHKVISDTTRPKRDYETDGVDYHFISIAEFAQEVLNENMVEATHYNGDWYYGTNINSLDENKINIAILNPEGILQLQEDIRVKVIPIRIKTNPVDRLISVLEREENPDCHEICRRFIADETTFFKYNDKEFYVYDNEVFNNYDNNFLDNLLDKINEITW